MDHPHVHQENDIVPYVLHICKYILSGTRSRHYTPKHDGVSPYFVSFSYYLHSILPNGLAKANIDSGALGTLVSRVSLVETLISKVIRSPAPPVEESPRWDRPMNVMFIPMN